MALKAQVGSYTPIFIVMNTVYTVWVEGSPEGDVFRGYNNKPISSHLDKRVANRVADINSGWVEEEMDNLHPGYIAQLEGADKDLAANQLRVSQGCRGMLSFGG